MIESSIVIPVYNKWDLTRQCLKSIAANTDKSRIEVIVVDNGSSDATEKGCRFLGKQLFGDSFHYIRNELNRNFAGACNQGAEIANGEYIIFLNNDTTVQEDWYQPLINDFHEFPDIAATGSLLIYPRQTPFGRMVQHLGVYVTPIYTLGHLYRGIPVSSPLARKRRFFQVITAACMVIRKSLFMEAGQFDEEFINGFEDVDLCARLTAKGYRLTVNPDSVVIHHESQTPGRHNHNEHNQKVLMEKSLKYLSPDYHSHLENDGLYLLISKWQTMRPAIPQEQLKALARDISAMSIEQLKEAIITNPYWEEGWNKIMAYVENEKLGASLYRAYFTLFREPKNIIQLLDIQGVRKNSEFFSECMGWLRRFEVPPAESLNMAQQHLKWFLNLKLPQLAAFCSNFIENYDEFREKDYPELIKELHRIEAETADMA